MTSSKYTIPVTKRANEIKYAIRDIEVYASKLERRGIDILKLNIGDPDYMLIQGSPPIVVYLI